MAFKLTGVGQEVVQSTLIPEVEFALISKSVFEYRSVTNAESIKFVGVGAVTTGQYDGTAPTATDHVDKTVILTLDQADYVLERVDKVDNEQEGVAILGAILAKGGVALADIIDKYALGTAAIAATTGTSTVALDESNVVKWVMDAGVALTKNGAPRTGRAFILDPEQSAILARAGVQWAATDQSQDAAMNGFIGHALGFDFYESTFLNDNAGEVTALAVAPGAMVVGVGFNEAGVGEKADDFKLYVKAIVNYGAKIIQDKFICKAPATIA